MQADPTAAPVAWAFGGGLSIEIAGVFSRDGCGKQPGGVGVVSCLGGGCHVRQGAVGSSMNDRLILLGMNIQAPKCIEEESNTNKGAGATPP